MLNPTSIYAYLADSDKEICNVTGLLPVPAGPAGAIEELTAADLLLFRHNPYPELAKGLAEYWMAPENLRVTIEVGDRRTKACTTLTSGNAQCLSTGAPC